MHRIEAEREDGHEERVFDHPEPFVQGLRHGDLAEAKTSGGGIGQFLQRAERAEPAAIDAPAPEQHAKRGEAPEDEDHRLDQEGFPAEAGQQRMDEGHDLHHRKLAVQPHAEHEEGRGQEGQPPGLPQAGAAGDPFLGEEDQGEDGQHQGDHGDPGAPLCPGLRPQRLGLRRRGQAEGLGQGIGQRQGHCHLARGRGAGGAQFDRQGLGGVDLGGQREEADFLHRRRIGQGERLQHLEAVFGRLPAGVALRHGDAVEEAGLAPRGAAVRLHALAHHDQGRAAGAKVAHGAGKGLLAKQVLAYGRRVDHAHPEL